MRNISILDDTFDINITSSYHLSIQISNNGLNFAVLDTVRMKFIALNNILFKEQLEGEALYQKLDNLFNTEGYLNRNYKYLNLYYVSPKATLIPASLYDETKKVSIEKLLGLSSDEHIVQAKFIQSLDSYILFSIPEKIFNLVLHKLDSPTIFHQSIPMIENAIIAAKGKLGSNRVYVNIHSDFADILVINDKKLLLFNSFNYQTYKDLAYYILNIYDQFKLPVKQTSLELFGLTDEQSDLYLLLKNYIHDIVFQDFNRSFSYSFAFNEIPQHYFSNLINLFRCE